MLLGDGSFPTGQTKSLFFYAVLALVCSSASQVMGAHVEPNSEEYQENQVWVLRGEQGQWVVVCLPHKVGSSTLKVWLFQTKKHVDVHRIGSDFRFKHGIFRWHEFPDKNQTEILQDRSTHRFAIIRDPLQRFVSGYNSKLNCSTEGDRRVREWSLENFGAKCFHDPNRLAEKIVHMKWEKMNSHFLAQRRVCGQHMNYDHQFLFEQMTNFTAALGPSIGISKRVKFSPAEHPITELLNERSIRALLKFYRDDLVWRQQISYTGNSAFRAHHTDNVSWL